jgi:hypothetical protein
MGKSEIREKLIEDAEKAGFIIEGIKHPKLEDRFSLLLGYHIMNINLDLSSIPLYRREYHGNELGDFNDLRPDFIYRDSTTISLIESKIGATQSYPYYKNMAICAQYARYADWLISAKVNRKMKTRNFIMLTSKDFLTEVTDKIPSEFRAALDYNSRLKYINGYYLIWEDIIAALKS